LTLRDGLLGLEKRDYLRDCPVHVENRNLRKRSQNTQEGKKKKESRKEKTGKRGK